MGKGKKRQSKTAQASLTLRAKALGLILRAMETENIADFIQVLAWATRFRDNPLTPEGYEVGKALVQGIHAVGTIQYGIRWTQDQGEGDSPDTTG